MIKTPEKIRIPAVTDDVIEVLCNWREGINGNFLKLRFNDQEAIIPRSCFSKAAFMLASEEEQDNMHPIHSIPVRRLQKVVTIQLKKDMAMGEYLNIPVDFHVNLNQGSELQIIHK